MKFTRLVLITSIILLLVSCANDVSKQPSSPRSPTKTSQADIEQGSQYYLEQARRVDEKHGDSLLRNKLLLQGAQSLQAENQCTKSIRLLNVIQSELYESTQRAQSQLLLAECYMMLPTPAIQQAQRLIADMALTTGFENRIYALEAQFDLHHQHWLSAANNLLASGSLDTQKSQAIWDILKHLDAKELEQARLSEPQLQAWIQLGIITQRFGLFPVKLKTALQQWQSRYTDHPLNQALPGEILAAIALPALKPEKVAVLLPLTGRVGDQGNAIKDGILAAYFDNSSAQSHAQNTYVSIAQGQSATEIRFFDSALKTPGQLNELVKDYDFIIGPLLKENIAPLIKLLPEDKPLLALNRIDTVPQVPLLQPPFATTDDETPATPAQSVNPDPNTFIQPAHETYFFALAPEDEAVQLAKHIHAKGYKRPIVLAADTSTTQRMSEAFLQQWALLQQQSRDPAPDHATFTDSKNMRKQVAELLDVERSKARIKQIENLTTVEVHAVERNRRDVDAIVLFANPEQTELLNPIIESSLSPFAATEVSVFASSRSYSLELTNNSIRDLRNLTFIDMPWMLPDNPWQSLASQSAQLWPQRQDTLLRLFAMGYDAYNLLPQLRHLKLLPQNSSQGLTGMLSINEAGEVKRVLPWAQVSKDKVVLIAMD